MKTFAELPYARPDFQAVRSELEAMTEKLKAAGSYEEMKDVFFKKQEMERELDTMDTICSIRADMDANTELPGLIPAEKAWNEALLASPYRDDFSKEFGGRIFTILENRQKVQSPEIAAELIEESELVDEYSKIAATCTVEFMGETCNFYGLLKHMESTDREERKAAFHAWAKLYAGVADRLDDVYHRMVQVRIKMAKKMGYDSYIPFAYLKRGRTDYGPEEAAA